MTTRVEPPQLAILLADNERLRALAASVIHDFNNFAAAIGGLNALRLPPPPPRRAHRHARLAVSATGRRTSETAGSRVFPGGYGLATVHDIVTRNGGAVSVTSGPGAGSTFEVYLPRLDNAVLERPLMPDVDLHHGSETVLVVENEEPVREMIVDVLSLHGYTALAAGDGEEALRVAATHRGALDLIIVDVVMPGISGEALAQRLTAGRPGTRVLYISGYTDDLIRQYGFTLASGHFLQKPFSVDDLARKVREVLRGRVA